MKNIDIDIDIDMVILENIDIDMDFLENIDIDKGILKNIDIDKISYRLEFGMSNRASLRGWGVGGSILYMDGCAFQRGLCHNQTLNSYVEEFYKSYNGQCPVGSNIDKSCRMHR